MVKNIPTRRYKIEFIIDTVVSEKQICHIIGAFDGYMIKIKEEVKPNSSHS